MLEKLNIIFPDPDKNEEENKDNNQEDDRNKKTTRYVTIKIRIKNSDEIK